MHRLLARQLRRVFGDLDSVPPELAPLLERIDGAYEAADRDRALTERSLELASRELLERNAQLRRDVEARAAAEARLQALLDAIPDELYVLDLDGVIVDAHDARGMRSKRPGYRSRSLSDLLPPALADEGLEIIRAVHRAGEGRTWNFSIPGDGDERSFEVRIKPEQHGRVFAILRDVTDARRMSEQLEIAGRMATVGTMAAGVAHEINNPLTWVLANLQHVADELRRLEQEHDIAADSDVLDAVSNAWTGAERVRKIVRELKTFSRADEEDVRPIDLHEAIDSAIVIAFPEIRNRARLVKRLGDVSSVHGDAAKLGQVFLNLLVNAAQALPMGRVEEHEITVTTRVIDADWVAVEVADTGPGIPDDLRDRIFDPFFTTKAPGVGTGLGLSICRNIVVALGGSISVATEAGGTTFTVRLRTARPRPAAEPSPVALPAANVRRRVLVVDDEPQVGRSLRRVLRDHDVTVVGGGQQGWAVLQHESFDIVLCDVVMPDLTGIELFERVERVRPEMSARFVFMTGGAFTADARRFLEARAPHVLDKPFDLDELRSVVSRATRYDDAGAEERSREGAS